ncbi:MAG: radical SAM protein, partial [Pseudorhodoplanes sp.]
SDDLIALAGSYADRLSMNVELPTDSALQAFAPEKKATDIRKGMAATRLKIEAAQDARKPSSGKIAKATPPRFAPAGQSTQMIVGADATPDATILSATSRLYASYALKRVYYSAFSPNGHPSDQLAPSPPPLLREHRLYQADWMLRFYGFDLPDIAGTLADGMLDLEVDPKLAWALAHREKFPVDVNKASREILLRVPGFGTRAVERILTSRRSGSLRYDDLCRLTGAMTRARDFIVTPDFRPRHLDAVQLRERFVRKPDQLSLFG